MPMTVSMNIRFCCHQNCRKYCSDNRLEDNRLTGMCPYMRTNIPFICIYDAYRRPVRRSVAPLQRYAETRPESRDDTSIYYNRYATLCAYGDKKSLPDRHCPRGSTSKEAATYSPALHCSTIGASGLNFSVRNGKRWDPTAIAT